MRSLLDLRRLVRAQLALRRRYVGAALALVAAFGLGQQVAAKPRARGPLHAAAPSAAASPGPARSELSQLRFERNHGQFDADVRFLARGQGHSLRLTSNGAVLSLWHAGEQAELGVRVVGGAAVEPAGEQQLSGESNYFVGEASRWRTGVESYARVLYPGVRPGVDVAFYGTPQQELEYDLLLGPGVDARSVELEFSGVHAIELSEAGHAWLRLPSGQRLRQHAPLAYQLDSAGKRQPVTSSYELRSAKRLGFRVGAHDVTKPLVIDPVLSYATYLGGQRFDQLNAVAVDAAGNTYAVGYTGGSLFPAVNPVQSNYGGGAQDAVICKLNAAGDALIYSTYLGGSGADQAYAIAVDQAGNAHVAGVTLSPNFPVANPYQATRPGGLDVFVAKLNASGSTLLYSTYLGGSADDSPFGIAIGPASTVYVTGATSSASFPVLNALQPGYAGGGDGFLTHIGPTGSTLNFSTFLGGAGQDVGKAVAATSGGGVLVAGDTSSLNFPVQSALQSTYQGGSLDAFVARVNGAGNALVFSTYLGGSFTDSAFGVVEQAGTPLVVGSTSSGNFPTFAAAQSTLASSGFTDAFVTRFSTVGTSLLFSTYLGGSGNDVAKAVAADNGHSYIVGDTSSLNLPLHGPLLGQGTYRGGASDVLLAGFTAGGALDFSSYLGGSGADMGAGIALRSGRAHVVGSTLSSDFPQRDPLVIPELVRASQDGFIVRLALALDSAAVPAMSWQLLLLVGCFLLGLGTLLGPRPRRS